MDHISDGCHYELCYARNLLGESVIAAHMFISTSLA